MQPNLPNTHSKHLTVNLGLLLILITINISKVGHKKGKPASETIVLAFETIVQELIIKTSYFYITRFEDQDLLS